MYGYNEATIYSQTNEVKFSKIIFFIKPFVQVNGEKKYLVTDTLKNVSVKINRTIDKVSDSYALDTTHIYTKENYGDLLVSEESLHYPVEMGVTMIPDRLTTAGQYADMLNDFLILKPGNYIFQLVSFDVKKASGNMKRIYTPSISFGLEVTGNTISANLGEFEIEIK
jgi:hypothetical protein